MHLQQVLKISYVRFSTCLNTSCHWLQNAFKNAAGDADSLTAVHSALLNTFYVVTAAGVFKCPKDWNQVSMGTTQWVLNLSINYGRCCSGHCNYLSGCNSKRKRLRTHAHVKFTYFLLCRTRPQSLYRPFRYNGILMENFEWFQINRLIFFFLRRAKSNIFLCVTQETWTFAQPYSYLSQTCLVSLSFSRG
jgi:hypothetical protein